MSNDHGISKTNILNSLPSVLAGDTRFGALAETVAAELEKRVAEADLTMLYKSIDSLPSDLLDILAYDFKVDWWDNDLSLTEKRNILKSSWHIHRLLGTRFAVENAIADIYEDSDLLEWTEYSGQPFYFKIVINSGEGAGDVDKLERIISRVMYYKSLRSVLEKICFSVERTTDTLYIGPASYGYDAGTYSVPVFDPSDPSWLLDENGAVLTDDSGTWLIV